MELTGLLEEEPGSEQVPQEEGPVVIRCDYSSIPDDKMAGIVTLMKNARFEAILKKQEEAYVILTGVLDNDTSEGFRDRILDAYNKSRRNGSD